MERLRLRDVRRILEFVGPLYQADTVAAFKERLADGLLDLVHGHICAYNEIDTRRSQVTWVSNPRDAALPGAEEVFARTMTVNPIVTRFRSGDLRTIKMTDFLSQRQFRDSVVYQEFYRPHRIEYILASPVHLRRTLQLPVVVFRDRHDFDERDRRLLHAVRAHVAYAFDRAESAERAARALVLLGEGLTAAALGVVIIVGGRVELITERARCWLKDYFPDASPRRAAALPEPLRAWASPPPARDLEARVARHERPFVARAGDRSLVVRRVEKGRAVVLLLREHREGIEPADLLPLGLSRREAEVLRWVMDGKTNADVAAVLGVSPRTVDVHMKHILAKLAVENRAAAVARALEFIALM